MYLPVRYYDPAADHFSLNAETFKREVDALLKQSPPEKDTVAKVKHQYEVLKALRHSATFGGNFQDKQGDLLNKVNDSGELQSGDTLDLKKLEGRITKVHEGNKNTLKVSFLYKIWDVVSSNFSFGEKRAKMLLNRARAASSGLEMLDFYNKVPQNYTAIIDSERKVKLAFIDGDALDELYETIKEKIWNEDETNFKSGHDNEKQILIEILKLHKDFPQDIEDDKDIVNAIGAKEYIKKGNYDNLNEVLTSENSALVAGHLLSLETISLNLDEMKKNVDKESNNGLKSFYKQAVMAALGQKKLTKGTTIKVSQTLCDKMQSHVEKLNQLYPDLKIQLEVTQTSLEQVHNTFIRIGNKWYKFKDNKKAQEFFESAKEGSIYALSSAGKVIFSKSAAHLMLTTGRVALDAALGIVCLAGKIVLWTGSYLLSGDSKSGSENNESTNTAKKVEASVTSDSEQSKSTSEAESVKESLTSDNQELSLIVWRGDDEKELSEYVEEVQEQDTSNVLQQVNTSTVDQQIEERKYIEEVFAKVKEITLPTQYAQIKQKTIDDKTYKLQKLRENCDLSQYTEMGEHVWPKGVEHKPRQVYKNDNALIVKLGNYSYKITVTKK